MKRAIILGWLGLLPACITVKLVNVDKKSTLEQQFIGEYEELSDDLVTMASVRAAIQSVAGSTMRKSGLPGATMLPGSTARWITSASIGARMRVCDQSARA